MDDPRLGAIEDLEDKFFQLPVKPSQGKLTEKDDSVRLTSS